MALNKFKFGDIFELKTSKGLAYLQYVNEYTKPPNYGKLVRVLDGTFQDRPTDFKQLVKRKELFYTFIPLSVSVRRKDIQLVEHEEVTKEFKKMPIFRTEGINETRTGFVNQWGLWDGNERRKIGNLKQKYINISSLATCNTAYIRERIEMGWLPKYDESVIGTKAFFEHFYPEIVKYWQDATRAIEAGNLSDICQSIGKISLNTINMYSKKKIDERGLFDYYSYIDFMIKYKAIYEIENDEHVNLLKEFRSEIKKIARYAMGFTNKFPDLEKMTRISEVLLNCKN